MHLRRVAINIDLPRQVGEMHQMARDERDHATVASEGFVERYHRRGRAFISGVRLAKDRGIEGYLIQTGPYRPLIGIATITPKVRMSSPDEHGTRIQTVTDLDYWLVHDLAEKAGKSGGDLLDIHKRTARALVHESARLTRLRAAVEPDCGGVHTYVAQVRRGEDAGINQGFTLLAEMELVTGAMYSRPEDDHYGLDANQDTKDFYVASQVLVPKA